MSTVALYGNSLVLASIGARIERRIGLQPVTFDAALPDAHQRLIALRPDVVLVDLGAAQSEPVIGLWKSRPELLLIGVDLATDRMLVLSGQPARGLTAEDLMETLTTHTIGATE